MRTTKEETDYIFPYLDCDCKRKLRYERLKVNSVYSIIDISTLML